jgi:N4-(beta-N-acetylglucosaminyl)-L-asparaginase
MCKSPEEACFEACKRIVDKTEPRLRRKDGKPNFNVSFYALNRKGEYGSAAIHQGQKFSIADGATAKLVESAYLYKRG